MSSLFKFYTRALTKHPFVVQAVQTGVLMGAGDVVAQKFIEKKTSQKFDYMRTIKFSSVGFLAGPALRVWYSVLNKYIGSSGKTVTLKKVLADQLLFAPCFLLFIVGSIGFTQTHDISLVKADLENKYPTILKTNYYIWPWVQLLNFYIVPFQYQVLFVQVVAVFWNTFLSWKTNEGTEKLTV